MFRRGIGRHPDAALKGQQRRDVDDLAPSPWQGGTREGLAGEEQRLGIHVHHRVPIGFGEIDRIVAADDARIVHQDVDGLGREDVARRHRIGEI